MGLGKPVPKKTIPWQHVVHEQDLLCEFPGMMTIYYI
jgi:hypothetical protein